MPERLTVQDLVPALERTGSIYLAPERKRLASGRLSCLYFNVGDLVVSFPDEKDLVIRALVQTYRDSGIVSDRAIGVPEGMNLLASSVGDTLRLGQLRVRESMTGHGDQRTIEGDYRTGQTIATFEDVMSTGGSTEKRAIEPIKAVGLEPNVVIALIDREYGGIQKIRRLGIPTFAFTTTTEIAEELVRVSALNDRQLRLLQEELEELKSFK